MTQHRVRFVSDDYQPHVGFVEGEYLQPCRGDIFGEMAPLGSAIPVSSVRILTPFRPNKIVCVGSNYRGHIAEMGRLIPTVPKLFMKPPTAVIGHLENIVLPDCSSQVEHEAELGQRRY